MVVNKADLPRRGRRGDAAQESSPGLDWPSATLVVSAQTGDGLKDLVRELDARHGAGRGGPGGGRAAAERRAAAIVLRPADGPPRRLHGGGRGRLLRACTASSWSASFAKADLGNETRSRYLQQVIERAGLNDALRRAGACRRRHGRRSASPSSSSRERTRERAAALLQSRP